MAVIVAIELLDRILHDDDDYMIVRPRAADSSCYYGKGTKWCISSTQSRNYFDQYTGEGVGFYFVLFKHLTQEDPYKKMALVLSVIKSKILCVILKSRNNELIIHLKQA